MLIEFIQLKNVYINKEKWLFSYVTLVYISSFHIPIFLHFLQLFELFLKNHQIAFCWKK